jgi:hypothetical protein
LRKDDLFVPVVPKSHPSRELFTEKFVADTETAVICHPGLLLESIQGIGPAIINPRLIGPTRLDD